MISIIIASANQSLLKEVSENIKNTIGVPFEILAFENSAGKRGICEVYNQGAKEAQYNILCFMHEDINIKTNNWGNVVMDEFEHNNKLGILGVAGCAYKSYAPSGWDVEGNGAAVRYVNYLQGSKDRNIPSLKVYYNPDDVTLGNVACVDGMWFCTPKSIAKKHPFDESTLTHFHGYDLDFCLNVGQFYEVAVSFNILMEHFSEGNFSKDWLMEIFKVHNKWELILPVNKKKITAKYQRVFEKGAYKKLVLNMLKFGFEKKKIYKILLAYKAEKKLDTRLFLKLNYYLFIKN